MCVCVCVCVQECERMCWKACDRGRGPQGMQGRGREGMGAWGPGPISSLHQGVTTGPCHQQVGSGGLLSCCFLYQGISRRRAT